MLKSIEKINVSLELKESIGVRYIIGQHDVICVQLLQSHERDGANLIF